MPSRTDEKPFKCNQCSYASNYSGNVLVHMQRHRDEKPFKCEQCLYAATTNAALQLHLRTHTKVKPYKCEHCPYATITASSLNRHIHTHTDVDSVRNANDDNPEMPTKASLQLHLRTHIGEKLYKCDQCSYANAVYCRLTAHKRTHTGEKPYTCTICSYAGAQSGNLQQHMRIHTGEKPYKCTFCSYASSRPGSLREHMRIHTGEKPYKCKYCSYASAKFGNLQVHIRTHTGEKPYKCTFCSYAGAQFGQLEKHMRTHTDVDCDRNANDANPTMQNNLSESVIDPEAVAESAISVMSDSDYLLPFETCLPENGTDFNESLELLYANPGMTDSINDNFCDIEHAKENVFGFDTEEVHSNRSAVEDDCESYQ